MSIIAPMQPSIASTENQTTIARLRNLTKSEDPTSWAISQASEWPMRGTQNPMELNQQLRTWTQSPQRERHSCHDWSHKNHVYRGKSKSQYKVSEMCTVVFTFWQYFLLEVFISWSTVNLIRRKYWNELISICLERKVNLQSLTSHKPLDNHY